MIEYFFRDSLSDSEKILITKYLDSFDFVTIEQYPFWEENKKVNYFYMLENGDIKCYTKIYPYQIKSLNLFCFINFGPISKSIDYQLLSLEKITQHCRTQHFYCLTYSLASPIMETLDKLGSPGSEYTQNKRFAISENWSSLILDLNQEENVLLKGFSKGHKSAIKKAEKIGLTVSDLATKSELDQFMNIYIKMRESRKLNVDRQNIKGTFENIYEIISTYSCGKILIIRDSNSDVIGGVVNFYQGRACRYYLGASDPVRRELPINHLAIWYSIRDAKSIGLAYYDLWGYTPDADEKSQFYHINTFKKGFGGTIITYPSRQYISIVKGGYIIFRLFSFLKNIYSKALG